MANLPIRDLGSTGVVTDVDPYNLPFNAFTRANNVRFQSGRVSRAPVFRTVKDSISFSPQHLHGINSSSGFDSVIVVSDDYEVHEYGGGTLNDRSGSISGSSSVKSFTSCSLADVTYINREDRVPVFRAPGSTNFADLTNWTSTHRTGSLRSFGDFLIASNITEGSTNFPNRVKWSNIAVANAIPDSWDPTDTTKSAGYNDLVQMTTPIIDTATLGSNLMIYSSDQVWQMEFVGGQFIFNFRKVFSDAGVINQNCVVEVERKHFVFDTNDIYINDGVSRTSIADQRVKDYIFASLNNSLTDRCFVAHNQDLEEIYFCYVSGDDMVSFTDTTGCNRAAVYNYRSNTWSFMDLPNVYAATSANVSSVSTYATATQTYADIGGTYYSQEAGYDQHLLMAGRTDTSNGITSNKLWGVDLFDTGSLSFSMDTTATKPTKLERVGIDLDESQLPLTGYKTISKISPQIETPNSDKNFSFTFGAAQLPGDVPTFGAAQVLNISTGYKLDTRESGRYLSYKLEVPNDKDFSFSSFDVEIYAMGKR